MQYARAFIELVALIKLLLKLYYDWKETQDAGREQEHSGGVDKLRRAESEKEIREALDQIVKNQ